MSQEEGKTFIFRTYRDIRDAVARKTAERVLEGRVGLGAGATYSANQYILEAVCDELGLQSNKEPAVQDVSGKIGMSLRFPVEIHTALVNKAKTEKLSFNEKLNQILQKKLEIDD